jgi:hypothetical protein
VKGALRNGFSADSAEALTFGPGCDQRGWLCDRLLADRRPVILSQ